MQLDLRHITACGECCDGCKKRAQGMCGGCHETQGRCEEWQHSGECPVYACARAHGVAFCGVCTEFPCNHMPMLRWRPDCVQELREMAEKYRQWQRNHMKTPENAPQNSESRNIP